MQNIIEKAVRPIDSEAYEILRSIQAYEYIDACDRLIPAKFWCEALPLQLPTAGTRSRSLCHWAQRSSRLRIKLPQVIYANVCRIRLPLLATS